MVDRLAFEDRGYILSTSESPGGRGINASRVIQQFGGKTMAIATTGGETGKCFEAAIGCCSFPTEMAVETCSSSPSMVLANRTGHCAA